MPLSVPKVLPGASSEVIFIAAPFFVVLVVPLKPSVLIKKVFVPSEVAVKLPEPLIPLLVKLKSKVSVSARAEVGGRTARARVQRASESRFINLLLIRGLCYVSPFARLSPNATPWNPLNPNPKLTYAQHLCARLCLV